MPSSRDSNNSDVFSSKNEFRKNPPFSIVWTPIPVISWLFPFIGHMGITTSKGTIYDFASPYHVAINDMAFGKPTKYYSFYPFDNSRDVNQDLTEVWDKSLTDGSREYNDYHIHNLFTDNCHSHVGLCLNIFEQNLNDLRKHNMQNSIINNYTNNIKGHNNSPTIPQLNYKYWNVPKLATILFFKGRYVSPYAFIVTWGPFIILMGLIIAAIVFTKIYAL